MDHRRRPTVLVTGGSSRIGRAVVAHLGSSPQLIFLLNRGPAPVTGPHVRTLTGGLAAASHHTDVIQSADLVLHMAGVSHATSDEAYVAVNERGTEALLNACRRDQPVIYLSTRCAGSAGGAYGQSKYRAEQAVVASGRPYVIIRPAEVYGTHSGEGIDALIDLALRWGVLLDFRWQPEIRYSPVSCDELGRFIAGVVTNAVSSDLSNATKTYTVCNNRSYTARDIQASMERGAGRRTVRLPVPIGVLKALASLPIPLPFARDQIDRLIMVKPDDNGPARRDYSFAPRCFLEYVRRDLRRV